MEKQTPDGKPTMKSLTLIGRRWFRRTYGNTYHTVQIIVDGETVHYSTMRYGYGDQYVQTAQEWLEANGYLPGLKHHDNGSTEPLWYYLRDKHGITHSFTAIDVPRQKDL